MDEDCLPLALWHDPCATGVAEDWTTIPSIYVAAAAFPELLNCDSDQFGEQTVLAHIEAIMDKCNMDGFFANRTNMEEVQVAANSAGYSSVRDYLKFIGKTTRFAEPSGTPADRFGTRRGTSS